jgi:tetratricopeptide (TPR) repeat protein
MLKALVTRNLCAAFLNEIHTVQSKVLNNEFDKNQMNLNQSILVGYEAALLHTYLGDPKLQRMGVLSDILSTEALILIGKILADNKLEFNIAIQKLDTAIALSPNSAFAYYVRAYLYGRIGETEKRCKDLIKTIDLSPNFAYPHYELSGLYYDVKKYDSAVLVLRTTLSFMPKPIQSLRRLAELYLDINQQDSFQYYNQKCIEFYPEAMTSRDLKSLGDAFADFKDYKKAIELYDKLNTIYEGKDGGIIYNLSCWYSLLKDKKNAIKYLDAALTNGVGFTNFGLINKDTDLNNIRNEPEYKAIMKKYFPKDYKE